MYAGKCGWIYVEKVDYARVKDINFSSARKLKAGVEKSLNDLSLCCKNDNSDQSSTGIKESPTLQRSVQQPTKD